VIEMGSHEKGTTRIGLLRPILEPGAYHPDGSFVFLRNLQPEELPTIVELTRKHISESVAPLSVVNSVYRHNVKSFWGIYRSSSHRRERPQMVGFWAILPLNEAGHRAIVDNTINMLDPDLALLAKADQMPDAFYLWAMVAKKQLALSYALLSHAFGVEPFEQIPFYVTASTKGGAHGAVTMGFYKPEEEPKLGERYKVMPNEQTRANVRAVDVFAYDPTRPRREFKTIVAATQDDMAKVFAIRAAVFIAEQKCPYDEEFDGNDYSGTHILGYVDGEPAAVTRIRYFADFVKLERLAVLPKFRRTLIAKHVVEHSIELCRRKGYTRIYGFAQKRLLRFWKRFGFQPLQKNRPVVFSDHEYIEVTAEFARHANAISLESDPMVIVRPEGRWDQPGVLDRSAARPPTNPH